MGYVYSPREIAAGEVATPKSFQEAFEITSNGLTKLHKDGHVIGSKIHGGSQLISEDYNSEGIVGGDLDALSVVGSVADFAFLAELYKDVWHATYVPLEDVPYPVENATSGSHGVDRFFAEYLMNGRHVTIGEDPFSIIKIDDSIPMEIRTRERLRSAIRQFGVYASSNREKFNADHCKMLEWIIRRPIYVALDVLRSSIGYTPNRDGKNIGKKEICELYRNEFHNIDTNGLFLILELRKQYRELINDPPVDIEEYLSLLQNIDSSLVHAYDFMTANEVFLSDIIEAGGFSGN